MTWILSSTEALAATATGIIMALVLVTGNGASYSRDSAPIVSSLTNAQLPSSAATPARLKPHIPVEVLRVIDGDTVEVRAQIWLDQYVTTKVRLRSIDAPESKSHCAEEKRKAEAARTHLIGLLDQQQAFLTDLGRDKFGSRVLGSLLTSAGTDVGPAMLMQGHAKPYRGGKRSGWC